MAKRKMSDAELTNDPSLRWCDYLLWEVLWSDLHSDYVRFLRFENGLIRVATLHGISNLPEAVDKLMVRRPSSSEAKWRVQKLRTPNGYVWIVFDRASGTKITCTTEAEVAVVCCRKLPDANSPKSQEVIS